MPLLFQEVPRVWAPAAIHDTVAAIARGLEYRRSLRQSFADRLLLWIAEGIRAIARFLRESHAARPIGYVVLTAIVLLVVARLVIAARARDETLGPRRRRSRVTTQEDPFAVAERLAGEGRYEEAAHALYRGVLSALARTERLRLDPSKTSGDYARDLRRRGSPKHQAFRAFARRFDVAVFGHGRCDVELIADLRALAAPLTTYARAA
jgi:hypothetical protein